MNRLSVLAIALSLLAAGCSSDHTTAPSAVNPSFTATLSPANEVPPIANAESVGRGTVTVTFNPTYNAGNITAATATFVVNLTGFPANTPINAAHIHPGAAGVNGGVLVSTGLAAGQLVLANGSGTYTSPAVTVIPEVAQQIIRTPEAYYFNVHSTINPGGVARGQLQRVP
jgi:CHRD domain-containing protein